MILIFGGAYQGKLDFAKETFKVREEDVYRCTRSDFPDFSRKVICDLELFFYKCVTDGKEAAELLAAARPSLEDKIMIVNDISQGIVPMEAQDRAWREMTGRAMLYLAREANQVYRVFCGLSQRLK